MNIIKESFDNLPIGICFFDSRGLIRLINKQMLSIGCVLLDGGFQTLWELRAALLSPPECVRVLDEKNTLFCFPDNVVLRFEEKQITDGRKNRFTQATFADVSALASRQKELKEENKRLDNANRRAKQLYDNMAGIVREEEILSMKMRVHDDIGHSILSARKALLSDASIEEIRSSASIWERSIDLLNHANNMPDETDDLEYAKERAAMLGVSVIESGDFPTEKSARKIFSIAVRECVTNCVRHAGGNCVFAFAFSDHEHHRLKITNNGEPPEREITEGGGLSALRKRIEKSGGTMAIKSLPFFELHITLNRTGGKP
ncbi:MAG: hypothetical protein J6D79_00745 [Clostridia bacterium]|nr:hypothetical protein [Clostridia bacterium]